MNEQGQFIDILQLDSIDSTNSEAKRQFESGRRFPLWIVAAEQAAGRGRGGRNWVSERGNLYATLLLPVDAPSNVLPQLSLVVAISVYETFAQFMGGDNLVLKWPNDCLAGSGKIAGILLEALSSEPSFVAVGMGLNIAHAPQAQTYETSCLKTYAKQASVNSVFAALNHEVVKWLGVWNDGRGFGTIREAWLSRSFALGSKMTIRVTGTPESGQFHGLGEDGSLLLKMPDGKIARYNSGDVFLIQGQAA